MSETTEIRATCKPLRPSAQVRTPTPFETMRVFAALRAHVRVIVAALLLGLFGGALVSRLSVALDVRAEARVRVMPDPAALARAFDDEVLQRARARAGFTGPEEAWRRSVGVDVRGTDQLAFVAHADSEVEARRRADALASAFLARASDRQREDAGARDAQRNAARAALERQDAAASLARAEALSQARLADPERELAPLRARRATLEAQLAEARVAEGEADARSDVYRREGRTRRTKLALKELSDAQRALSALLTSKGEGDPEVIAQRARIQKLQTSAVTPQQAALGNRAEARAQAARVRELEAELATLSARLQQLGEAEARLAPLTERRDQVRAQLEALGHDGPEAPTPSAALLSRARVTDVGGKVLRVLVAAAVPLLTLCVVVLGVILRELRDFRVCAGTELAHHLGVPVLVESGWPARESALDGLIDPLFDGAIAASGTTLIVPLSEGERPLAQILAARINARAQRHFRSTTGARIALAQAWEGELAGTRLTRAAEVADRVLWVVAADQYYGKELRHRSAAVTRLDGVAAILVDAADSLPLGPVGDAARFWRARSTSRAAENSVPPVRVPLHQPRQ